MKQRGYMAIGTVEESLNEMIPEDRDVRKVAYYSAIMGALLVTAALITPSVYKYLNESEIIIPTVRAKISNIIPNATVNIKEKNKYIAQVR